MKKNTLTFDNHTVVTRKRGYVTLDYMKTESEVMAELNSKGYVVASVTRVDGYECAIAHAGSRTRARNMQRKLQAIINGK